MPQPQPSYIAKVLLIEVHGHGRESTPVENVSALLESIPEDNGWRLSLILKRDEEQARVYFSPLLSPRSGPPRHCLPVLTVPGFRKASCYYAGQLFTTELTEEALRIITASVPSAKNSPRKRAPIR